MFVGGIEPPPLNNIFVNLKNQQNRAQIVGWIHSTSDILLMKRGGYK